MATTTALPQLVHNHNHVQPVNNPAAQNLKCQVGSVGCIHCWRTKEITTTITKHMVHTLASSQQEFDGEGYT